MIFEQERIGFSILDVLALDQSNIRLENRGRHFSALSFRYPDSDAQIEANGQTYAVGCALGYFPAHLTYTRTARRDKMLVIHFENHTYYTNKPEFFAPKDPEDYRPLFEEAYAVWHSDDPAGKLRVSAILYEIFARAYLENRKSKDTDSLAARALGLLDKYYSNSELTVSQIARELYVSEAYLRRVFHEAYGESPKHCILRRRIDRAIALLETNYYTVAEVAEMSGFRDPRHFSTVFKKTVGRSPSDYRYDFKM